MPFPQSQKAEPESGDMRLRAFWTRGDVYLEVREPDAAELARAAETLSIWYSDPSNLPMMLIEKPIPPEQIPNVHHRLRAAGGRTFLLFCDGELVGDADFRHIESGRAEFAILVGQKGRGLGTSFSILLAELAFRHLGLHHIYLTVILANLAARRCYEKVGFRVDDSPIARSYIDADTDIAMVLSADTLYACHGTTLDAITVELIPDP